MTKDNSTGKDKEFYARKKKMFERLNHQIAINTEVVGYVAPQRTWVGLTDEDLQSICDEWQIYNGAWMDFFVKDIETKLKEKNT